MIARPRIATAPSRKTFPPASIVTTVPLVSKRSMDSLIRPPLSIPGRPLLLLFSHELIILIFGDEGAALDLAAQLAPAAIVLDLGAHNPEAARVHNLLDQPVARCILIVAILDHQVVAWVDAHMNRRATAIAAHIQVNRIIYLRRAAATEEAS